MSQQSPGEPVVVDRETSARLWRVLRRAGYSQLHVDPGDRLVVWVEGETQPHLALEELEEAQVEALERLALTAEYRDDKTGQHAQRVGQMAALLARTLGLPGAQVALIRRAAPLHDMGKIAIPDYILLKQGTLTPEEFALLKTHTTVGARILGGSRFTLLQEAQTIALTHHERWDGTGYPNGIAGEEIPLSGRITAVADVFDALTHHRPYKEAWAVEAAVQEIIRGSGTQFAPEVVAAFQQVMARGNPVGAAVE